MMGGTITACSILGQGTTFTLRLPLSPAPPFDATGPAPTPAASWPELRGLPCLVIGDAHTAADDLSIYLHSAGAQVQRACDGAAAAALLTHAAKGRCVAVIANADNEIDDLLVLCRSAGRKRPGLALRFVVIEHGRRRRPRVKAADLVSLDGGSLHRAAFMQAVALAGGTVLLPEVQDTTFGADSEQMSLSGPEVSPCTKAILVAEDNAINQKVLLKQLAVLGFDADMTGNGQEALERWRSADYGLLITDLHMPVMDGYELATAIRAAETDGCHIPIVALTANAVKGEARRCHDIGMDDYLTKPVQLSVLKALLVRWLRPAGTTKSTVEAGGRVEPGVAESHATGRAPPADLDILVALIGDDESEIFEVLDLFRSISEQTSEQIRVGIATRNAKAVSDAAHTLKSNARAIGALALGQICEDIERQAQAADDADLHRLFAAFETELAVLRHYLNTVVSADADGARGLQS